MKILFKNTTKYNKENCDSFLEFHTHKYGKKELIKLIILGLAILYIIIFNIINRNWILVLSIIIIGGIIYLIQKNKYKNKNKKRERVKEYTFYFYENYIKIKCRRKFDRLTYFKLYKIFETDEYFFLYTDENSSLILNKNGFEIGSPKEFSVFIKSKCPLKYKNQNK